MERRMKNTESQTSEEPEVKADAAKVKLFMACIREIWDQHNAKRNSTAPSSKPEETGKELAVRHVNPSPDGQHGGEHVTSIANALEVNGDAGIEKQTGKRSEELMGLAIRDLQGASQLNPLPTEGSESDSDLPTMIHPSAAPEGSLLHALYLQLLGSGNDGITVRELFKCLKKPAEVLDFAFDWKKQVRRHLKTNTHFGEVKGHHFLVWNDQQEVQQPTQSPANNASTPRRHGESSSQAVLPNLHPDPATVQTGLSVDTHQGVVRTRRKAFQKAIASISDQAKEFEEVHQSTADMQIMPSSVANPTDAQLVSHGPLPTPSRKRKSFSSHDEEVPDYGHHILHSTQGENCADRNDDDDSSGDQLQDLQMPKMEPKRHHVAARKSAANVGPVGLIRTPIIPPLPPNDGFRRKTPTGEE